MSRNRSIGVLIGAFLFLAPFFAMAETNDYSNYSFARLSYVKGEVSVQRASDLGTETAEVNLPLVVGDKLLTMDGQAEVQFGRRNYLRLDSFAQAEFALLPSEVDGRIKIHLLDGRAYLRVVALDKEKGIEVHSPDASFYILEEGLYRFEVDSENETGIFVYEGSVEAAGEKGSILVRAREKLVASRGEILSDPETFYARSDGFDQWNESRDELLARRSSSAYLPSAISEYEEELADNGRWVYEQPYGNVWVPYVHHIDWRPYYFGRWVWYPIIGWTWVSSEPWGWCTHHYGRWHWRINLGWYWIPRTHWGPAWVHWYHDHNYVGWCPLSYYNRPVVIIDNHFYDHHHDPYYPIHSRALTMVRRDQLQSPAISRHALAASQFTALKRISLQAEQPAIKPVIQRSVLRSPGMERLPDGAGSRVIRSYTALSSQSLRSPSSGIPSGVSSRTRSISSGSSRGLVRGSLSGSTLRTYPSSNPRPIYGTSTSIRADKTSSPRTGYPSRILMGETKQTAFREYSTGTQPRVSESRFGRISGHISSYPSSISGSATGSGKYSLRSSSPSVRSYSTPGSGSISSPSFRRSYSIPSSSYSSRGLYSGPSRSFSPGSTYSGPPRSTSSGSYSSIRSNSSPSRSSGSPRISSSSRGSSSSISSGSRSSSSSSVKSGSIRKK